MSVRPACTGNRARLLELPDLYRGRILDYRCQVSGVSAAAGLNSGQSDQKRNFEEANMEYRIMNVEGMYFDYFKKD